MVCPYLKNKGSAVRFCRWPLMSKIINLEKLVGSKTFNAVKNLEDNSEIIFVNSLRGKEIKFNIKNLRSLWQSAGQEYIEPDLLNFIDNIEPNGIYFDIGASIGNFCLYAASKEIKVFAFEPEITNHYLLLTNSLLNEEYQKNLKSYCIAIGEKHKFEEIKIEKFEISSHQKRINDYSFNPAYSQKTFTISLDDFCKLENIWPTDIKIDVDGYEEQCVGGMKENLTNGNLKNIFIEIDLEQESSIKALDEIQKYKFEIISSKQVQNYKNLYNYVLSKST